jgi:hypothetical protein
MNERVARTLILCAMLACGLSASAATEKFGFAIISPPLSNAGSESALRAAIEATDAQNFAFVVANGIKSVEEPCTDETYSRRKILLDSAKNGLIVSLAASDWAYCRDENGKSAAIGRMTRMREMFFPDQFSFGATRIPLVQQSASARFRTYVENVRWEIGDVIFATIDLPANNNHYLVEAGRNSEFEDRLVANRNWLHQIFTYAKYRKLRGVVLFSDGNPLSPSGSIRGKRDGFAEIRHQIITSATRFPGMVLIVHGSDTQIHGEAAEIHWHGRLGELAIAPGWTGISVTPSLPAVFTLQQRTAEKGGR